MRFSQTADKRIGEVRNRDEMDVVAHQTVPEYTDTASLTLFENQVQVESPIAVGDESDFAVVAPLSNVVRDARRNHTCHSRH